MAIHRLNHAVLYVRDLARTRRVLHRTCSDSRVKFELAGQACVLPGARGRPTTTTWGSSPSEISCRTPLPAGRAPSGSTTWHGRSRTWPIWLDHAERFTAARALGGRILEPRHDQEPVRQGP